MTPKDAGNYRFFIYSDDSSELYLSTDDKPANVKLIAEETGCCNNFTEPGATHDEMLRTSDPLALVAGKPYFIRLVNKEGGGGDYGQVAWRKEGDRTAAAKLKPIPSQFLSAAVALPGPPTSGGGSTNPPSGTFSSVAKTGNNLVVAFSSGTLEQAATVKGPWTAVTPGTSPATIPITRAQKFLRLR